MAVSDMPQSTPLLCAVQPNRVTEALLWQYANLSKHCGLPRVCMRVPNTHPTCLSAIHTPVVSSAAEAS